MTKTNFIEADVIKNNDMMELDIPILFDECLMFLFLL